MCKIIGLTSTFLFFFTIAVCQNNIKDTLTNDKVNIDTSDYFPGDLNYNLIIAANNGYTKEVLRLLNKGADIDASIHEGITPLMYAVQEGYIDVVKILVLNGADINKKPYNGISPLISSVINNNLEIAEYLIRNGADIDQPDFSEVTPLMYAIANGNLTMTDILLYYECDYSKKDIQGIDALSLSAYLGYIEITRLLLQVGADVNTTDDNGNTPLHIAVQNGFIETADSLIEHGANLELQNRYGYSPLAIAVENNDIMMSKFLLNKGADPNKQVSSSLNPLTIAINNRNDSLKTLLLEKNAKRNWLPSFYKYNLGTYITWNISDFLWGFDFGISDRKYNFDLVADYKFRPFAIRVLEKENPTTYYQYWERRAFFSLGLDKKFIVIKTNNYNYGLICGVKESLTFGSYRGTKTKPDISILTVPRIGVLFASKSFTAKLAYEYMNLNLYKVKTGWINTSFSFNINRKKNFNHPTNINWL